jgi:anti-sigma regulatory factor (Ser/Thr protein kinase)
MTGDEMRAVCETATASVISESRELLANGHAPAYARYWVRRELRAWGLGGLIDTAELVVSELVSNAVQHGGGESVALSLECSGGSACIRVWDPNGRAMPALLPPDDDDERGRGLVLVDALSAHWGAYRLAAGGKVTFAELRPA